MVAQTVVSRHGTPPACPAAAYLQGAMTAARLEEDTQMEEWGAVEAGHDLDIADITTRVSAPSVFVRLLAMK